MVSIQGEISPEKNNQLKQILIATGTKRGFFISKTIEDKIEEEYKKIIKK
jgi:hypothetical protein